MAARKVSLAEELLHAVSPMPYKTFVANIKEEDALSPDTFKNIEHTLDKQTTMAFDYCIFSLPSSDVFTRHNLIEISTKEDTVWV